MTARLPFRIALILLTAAALSACGRKGGLDLPPQAQAAPVTAEPTRDPGPGSILDQAAREPEPETPRGNKRRFILDPLLGE